MDKYKVTEKNLKTRSATYYRAINIQTNQKVLIKKLNKGRSWEDLLSDKFINLLKLQKYSWAPKIIQIIKDQDRHYIIFENLQASLTDMLAKDKSTPTILGIAKRINEVLCQLKDEGINIAAIKAEYFFIEKDDIKLTHIPQGEQIDLTNASPERANNQTITDKSNIFELACLMVQSLTGKPLIQASNKKQYQAELAKLFPPKGEQSTPTSIRSILKTVSNDYELIQLVESMLSPDPNKRPGNESVSISFKRFSSSSPNKSNNKLLFFSTLQKIDSNKINILRKCNQISTRFLEDDYSQLAQIPRIISQTQALPPEQNATDNTVLSKIKPQHRNLIAQHPLVSPKNRQKGTQTLPRLFNRKEQHTNYALYKHQHLGLESDHHGSQVFGEEKFTQI